MIDSAVCRALSAIVALVAGLAAPALSLAHGHAHADAAGQHDVDLGHGHISIPAHIAPGSGLSLYTGDDHPHPRMDLAPTTRVDTWAAATALPVVEAVEITPVRPSIRRPHERLPGPAPPENAPPRLRAPPLS